MGILSAAVFALALTMVLTLLLRPVAIHFQLTDKPGGRKQHIGEIPLVGGIAMLISIIVGLAVIEHVRFWHFLLPAAILVLMGVVDDRRGVRVSVRLATQVAASLAMMLGGGLFLRDIGDPFGTGILGLGSFAIPLSVVIALTVINAFNFVDGIDGLAASMALIALGAGALVSGLSGPPAALAALACGAILGFLPFNFPGKRNSRVRTFMGDAGSTLLGFIVVWFTIAITQGDSRALVTGRSALVCPDAAIGFLQLRRASRGSRKAALESGPRTFPLHVDARRTERAPDARRACGIWRDLCVNRCDRRGLEAAGLELVCTLDTAADFPARDYQGFGWADSASSLEIRRRVCIVACR